MDSPTLCSSSSTIASIAVAAPASISPSSTHNAATSHPTTTTDTPSTDEKSYQALTQVSGNCQKDANKVRREDQPASLLFTGISVADELRLNRAFITRKKMILEEIARHSSPPNEDNNFDRDKSVKGFLDEKCLPICNLLNTHPDYVTTSSCSGRISLFHTANEGGFAAADTEDRLDSNVNTNYAANVEIDTSNDTSPTAGAVSASSSSAGVVMKRGDTGSLGWVVVTHETALNNEELDTLIDTVVRSPPAMGVASFKVEPFVMHVQCKTLTAAKELLTAALEAGFRNSGVIPPGKNIMVGIRHAGLSMDVPLVDAGCPGMAPTEAYVRRLSELATSKMMENDRRIAILEKCIRNRILKPTANGVRIE